MEPFPDKKYSIIYADPPWRNPKSGTKARNNEKHYPSMDTAYLPEALPDLWQYRDRLRTVQAQGGGAVALLVYEVPGLY